MVYWSRKVNLLGKSLYPGKIRVFDDDVHIGGGKLADQISADHLRVFRPQKKMPAIARMAGDKAFAVVMNKRQQVGFLLVGDIPGPFSHIEDGIEVIKISYVVAGDRLLGEQVHIGADHRDPGAGLTAQPLDGCQGMRSRVVMIAGRGIPFLRIGDGQDSLLAWPRIVGRPGWRGVLCQQLWRRAVGLCARQRGRSAPEAAPSLQEITSLHTPR